MISDKEFFYHKKIVICGGSGFYGKNFAEYCLQNDLFKKICLLSRGEYKQSELKRYFSQKYGDKANRLRFLIGDVRDKERLSLAFKTVDYVINAAALKRIEVVNYNPQEAVYTNLLGQMNVVSACIEQNVDKSLFISSDKAINGALFYGQLKACAEHYTVLSNAHSSFTRFNALRYGNITSSSGSCLEYFLTGRETFFSITHPEMTRFFININNVVELSLYSLKHSLGGEVYIPQMKSCKMTDMARLIDPDKPIKYIGFRTLEKMSEQVVNQLELDRLALKDGHYIILPYDNTWHSTLNEIYQSNMVNVDIKEFDSATAPKFSDQEIIEMINIERKRIKESIV